jgi:hypothetical protein
MPHLIRDVTGEGQSPSPKLIRVLRPNALAFFDLLIIYFKSGILPVYTVHRDHKTTICSGCGLELPNRHIDLPDRFNASGECWQLFSDLSFYTVSKQDAEFIHQYAVDAYEAQHAGGKTRNITAAFGLIGLYLALEKGYTGKQVQQAHMQIAKIRKDWSRLEPPVRPAQLTVMDVLKAPDGMEKDTMIRQWMKAVWENWADRQMRVREATDALLGRGKG